MGDEQHHLTSTLFVAVSAERLPLDGVDVKAETTGDLLGTSADFLVIGDSHAVRAPELDYFEVCSCRPVADGRRLPLEPDTDAAFVHEGRVRARTRVESLSLDAFDPDENYDVVHRFDARAWTAVRVSDGGYETFHTYPERALTLRTRTDLTER